MTTVITLTNIPKPKPSDMINNKDMYHEVLLYIIKHYQKYTTACVSSCFWPYSLYMLFAYSGFKLALLCILIFLVSLSKLCHILPHSLELSPLFFLQSHLRTELFSFSLYNCTVLPPVSIFRALFAVLCPHSVSF